MSRTLAFNPATRFASFFTHRAAWVENLITRISQPYILDDSTLEALERLLAKKTLIAELDSTAIRTLEAIGAIFDDSTIENQTKSWIAHLERCRNELRQQNWAVVRSLYNPAGALTFKNWVEYMQPYYRHTGKLANRIEQHNEILCRSFHSEFSKILVPLFPEPVKPSYCFLGIYHNQARLPKHIDREQCQWNVSVILDSSPNITDLDDSWPIYLEPVPNKYVELRATIGDAVIYRGNKMPHWRDRLPARFNQVSICFFHYVHQDFAGSLD